MQSDIKRQKAQNAQDPPGDLEQGTCEYMFVKQMNFCISYKRYSSGDAGS